MENTPNKLARMSIAASRTKIIEAQYATSLRRMETSLHVACISSIVCRMRFMRDSLLSPTENPVSIYGNLTSRQTDARPSFRDRMARNRDPCCRIIRLPS